jgi:hypothetical protein
MNMNNTGGMAIPMQVGSFNFSRSQSQNMYGDDGERGDLENYLSNLDLSNV